MLQPSPELASILQCKSFKLQVLSIQASVPSLQELHLCNNDIRQLSGSDAEGLAFPRLQVFNLAVHALLQATMFCHKPVLCHKHDIVC